MNNKQENKMKLHLNDQTLNNIYEQGIETEYDGCTFADTRKWKHIFVSGKIIGAEPFHIQNPFKQFLTKVKGLLPSGTIYETKIPFFDLSTDKRNVARYQILQLGGYGGQFAVTEWITQSNESWISFETMISVKENKE